MRNAELELKQMSIVKSSVKKYFDDMANLAVFEFDRMTEKEKDHILDIACSIMNARLEIGFTPGSFVQAVIDNNLLSAFANADSVNQRAIKFYLLMIYNLGIDISISEETITN